MLPAFGLFSVSLDWSADMKKIFACIFSIFLTAAVFSQGNIRNVKIVSKNSNDRNSLSVYEVSRKTEIVGNYSSTTIEYMIENRSNRVLEGEFEFSLEDGESVAGYALDINGVMRQGVAVEKDKGREVFEDVVRRNVDPGLVEMTAGNNFKTRVYPINANGVRHIEVTVEKELKGRDIQKQVYIQNVGRDTYFYFYQDVQDYRAQTVTPNSRNIVVLYDVSDSAKNRDVEKEIEFLKAYSSRLGNPRIKFVTFADKIVDSFDLDFGRNARNSADIIRDLDFDGATNLDVIKDYAGMEVLLFSDGIDNWGDEELNRGLNGYGRISTINTSRSASFGTLKKIAGLNDGVYINLNESDVWTAVNRMFENPLKVISVDFGRSDMTDVYPGVGTVVDGGISVAGIMKGRSGRVKISLGRNGRVEQVIERDISSYASYSVEESSKVSRLWAMKKIADLEMDYEWNRNEIISLAKKYTIVTKDTSLIVLDSVEDYVRYGIEPPAELKKEYDRLVSRRVDSKKVDDGIPNEVYTKFEEFKRWWEKRPEDFKKTTKKMKERSYILEDVDGAIPGPRYMMNGAANSNMSITARGFDECDEACVEEEPSYSDSYESFGYNGSSARGESAKKMSSRDSGKSTSASITLQAWSSNSDYIAVLKKAGRNRMRSKYRELKKTYGSSPAFYMEVSDYFVSEGYYDEGMRILSNLAEMNLENTDVLRALGNKLVERKEYERAIRVFKKLTVLRPEVPQFHRDLALAYEETGNYQAAVDSLWYIASNKWDSRYAEIQQTALNDMNAIIATKGNVRGRRIDTSAIDRKLIQNFDVGLRIVLTWNTDDCDIDLWVTDPNREKCYYGHKETDVGGRMSRDFTQGYGPEEFCLKVAPSGKYKIECNYYGNHQQKLLQPVIVQAEVYTNFGRPNQKKQVMTLQLDDVKQTFLIGEIDVR